MIEAVMPGISSMEYLAVAILQVEILATITSQGYGMRIMLQPGFSTSHLAVAGELGSPLPGSQFPISRLEALEGIDLACPRTDKSLLDFRLRLLLFSA